MRDKKNKAANNHSIIKPWYAELNKRLKSHFKSVQSLQQAASEKNPESGGFLQKVNQIIDDHLDQEGFNASDLAKVMAMSRSQLLRKVKPLTQMSPATYLRFVRLNRSKELLESGKYNVSEVAYMVGFVSSSHFTRSFQKEFGFTPSLIKRECNK